MHKAVKVFFRFRGYIWNIGYRPSLGSYEQRKLGIFNTMNFLGLLTGGAMPLLGLFNRDHLPVAARLVACSPALISFIVLITNGYQRYELGRIIYFTLYPVV